MLPRFEPGRSSRYVRPPSDESGPPAGLLVPNMLRGFGHGDLHGRNVLVGLVRGQARWPALFDYENMGPDNLLAWDFVKIRPEFLSGRRVCTKTDPD